MSKWVRVDRRYNNPYRLTGYAVRVFLKWAGVVMAWILPNALLAANHAGFLILLTTARLGWYAGHSARASPRALLPPSAPPRPVPPAAALYGRRRRCAN